MELVNPRTSFQWTGPLNINGVAMKGVIEKQGHGFSRHGWLSALDSPHIDADSLGKAYRQALRPLSRPTLEKARREYGDRTPPKFPRYFIIEPTAVCNRACPFCTILVTNRKGMMKWGDFTKLMQECSEHDVYGASLYQLGEPFLWSGDFRVIDSETKIIANGVASMKVTRRNIADMVNYTKRIGGFKIVNLSTNGDVSNLDCVLGSELSDLIISIDGTTPEVYSANRPSTKKNDLDAFQRTLDRTHAFLERKSQSGEPRPFVRLQCINKENTADQIVDFIKYWIQVPGVDDVFVKNLDSMRPWLGNKVVSDEEDQLKALRLGAMPCQHIYSVGSMTVDGSLNACCHDSLTELTTVGANIRNMTFAEWWNGEYMTAMRRDHSEGNFHPTCNSCRERDTWLG